jgi:hypothetical protein
MCFAVLWHELMKYQEFVYNILIIAQQEGRTTLSALHQTLAKRVNFRANLFPSF